MPHGLFHTVHFDFAAGGAYLLARGGLSGTAFDHFTAFVHVGHCVYSLVLIIGFIEKFCRYVQ